MVWLCSQQSHITVCPVCLIRPEGKDKREREKEREMLQELSSPVWPRELWLLLDTDWEHRSHTHTSRRAPGFHFTLFLKISSTQVSLLRDMLAFSCKEKAVYFVLIIILILFFKIMNASRVITKVYFCSIFKNNRIQPKLAAKIPRYINIMTHHTVHSIHLTNHSNCSASNW